MNTAKSTFATLVVFSFSLASFGGDRITTGVTVDSKDQTEGAIVIQKNVDILHPKDFEIVTGSDEIAGDPSTGNKDAYASWKTACADWKKDLKENNKENTVVSANCGSAKQEAQKDVAIGTYIYKSTGTYKIKVRVRGSQK